MASAVWMPWPISLFGMITVTRLSGPTLSQPLKAGAAPPDPGVGSPSRRRGGSNAQPTVNAPAAARVPSMKWRFFMGAASIKPRPAQKAPSA